jgi:hypothetical protein
MAHFDDSPKAPSRSRSQEDLLEEDLGTTSGSDGEDLETLRGAPEEPAVKQVAAVARKEQQPKEELVSTAATADMPPKKRSKAQSKPRKAASSKKKVGKPKVSKTVKENKQLRKLAAQMVKVGT